MKWIALVGALLVGAVAVIVIAPDDEVAGEVADITGQGLEGDLRVSDGATLHRRTDGVTVHAAMPTPEPGSYEYPEADMVAKWAQAHPEVLVGSADEPETFTFWIVVFSFPELCTDGECGADDTDPGAAAKGGVFQGDARIADGDQMEMVGSIRVGEVPLRGAPFEQPLTAEVHIAIAPHGKALSGEDLWRQLNGPLGNPTLWWGTSWVVTN